MKAIDTNVVIRIVAEDDIEQTRIALAAVGAGAFVSSGVLIETEWVLRSSYRMSRAAIVTALEEFLVLEGIEFINLDAIRWVLGRYASGADFADMMHLVDAAKHDAFLTFDRDIQRDAGEDAPLTVEILQ